MTSGVGAGALRKGQSSVPHTERGFHSHGTPKACNAGEGCPHQRIRGSRLGFNTPQLGHHRKKIPFP